jgi:large repetitive protein
VKTFLLTTFLLGSLTVFAANPAPSVSQPLVPPSVAPGSATFTLTVNGTGFVSGTVVNWNRAPRPTTFVSSSRVTAQISAADVAHAGTNSVYVTNPAPGGGSSDLLWFAVTKPTTGITLNRSSSGIGSPPAGHSIVIGDFNHDGKPDTAVLGSNHGDIQLVISGNVPTQLYDLGPGLPPQKPMQVAIGDFNGDGVPDLVVAAGPVWVLLGNGNGTFQAPTQYLPKSLSGQVVVRDIDGDGTLDLVLGAQPTDGMDPVLLGNGDGTFRNGTSYAGGTHVVYMVAGDFNGDGLPDLAVSPDLTSGQVCIKFGNGDGTFTAGPCTTLTAGTAALGMAVADFNGDGKADLAITPNWIALGNGDGTFLLSQTGGDAISFTAGDMNGDGLEDLVFTTRTPAIGLSVLQGNGSGQFSFAATVPFPSKTPAAAVADFNGDGRLDVAGSRGAVDIQAPAVTLHPVSLTFPPTPVGNQSKPKTLTVTNTGSADLTITSVSTTTTDYSASTDCPNVLVVGAICSINVVFAPTIVGSDLADLRITDNAHGGVQIVHLHGRGI